MAREAFVYVDGAYLRKHATMGWPNPMPVAESVASLGSSTGRVREPILIRRVSLYEAEDPSAEDNDPLRKYLDAVDRLQDCHVRTGRERMGQRRGDGLSDPKAVRVLLAVDMLTDADHGVFDVGVLIAGDADFVPLVDEVLRRGKTVLIGSFEDDVSVELRAAADRWAALTEGHLVPLEGIP